jgi:predicted outer membrane repeat protein
MKRVASIGIAAGVLLAVVAGASAGAYAGNGRPPCLVSNERTGLGSRSLQEGIDAAAAGDMLVVKGTCFGASTIDLDLKLKGVANPAFGIPTLDGTGFSRPVLAVDSGPCCTRLKADISNLTITHGSASGLAVTGYSGAEVRVRNTKVTGNAYGIETWESTLSLVDSSVKDNGSGISGGYATTTLIDSVVSGNGGGLGGTRMGYALVRSAVRDNDGPGLAVGIVSSASVVDSVISGNASGGIALASFGSSWLQVTRSTITDNDGPGVTAPEGNAWLTDSTVSDNTTGGSGGGIYGDATLANSRVTGNSAGLDGGGIAGSVTLTNSTVSGNTAGRFGGGIYVPEFRSATLNDSSVTGNTAGVAGGGIYGTGTTVLNGTSSVCGNAPDDWPGCSP